MDDERIYEIISYIFTDIGESISKKDKNITLKGNSSEEIKIGSSEYIRLRFRRIQDAGSDGLEAVEHYRYEYFIYPLERKKPQRISQYLLNTVFITYGNAYERELENFGTISLIELLRSENPEDLLLEAIEESHRYCQDRYRGRAEEAVNNLKQLQSKVDTGEIERYSDEEEYEDEFLEGYSAKKFEKDVFHLLKSLFMFTERWGREGKKETDGLLTIPKGDEYWVGGYDPKLTTDPKGYNIRSTEKDKVVYYILEESDREYIQEVLKDGDSIDGHIFISDIFREGQFSTTVERVREWFNLVEGKEEKLEVPIIFMRVSHLIELYDIFESNYTFLREYSDVMSTFREAVLDELSAQGGYIEFDDSSCRSIKKKVVQALDKKRKSRDTQEYAE